ALLADLVEFYEPIAEEAGAHLSVDMALRGAGAGAALPLVATSRHLLAQAVSNLLENALKYGRPVDPKRPFEVLVRLSADEEAVKLAVLDHGAGIPEAARARVFERFVRLDNSRTTPGTGLGLSLVAAVARLSQGSVQLSDNRPGLVATLILPRERSDAPREAQQARLRSVGAVEAPAAMVRA
ncbi:MAG: sensor histidine kinase, partial [Hyphomicrobiaceae bacterium]